MPREMVVTLGRRAWAERPEPWRYPSHQERLAWYPAGLGNPKQPLVIFGLGGNHTLACAAPYVNRQLSIRNRDVKGSKRPYDHHNDNHDEQYRRDLMRQTIESRPPVIAVIQEIASPPTKHAMKP
jgi:hypothetical protein